MPRRLIRVLTVLLLLLASAHTLGQQQDSLPALPPLVDPPTNERLPGKFVWADLFTNDVTMVRRFYEQLLGWEWRWVSEPPNPYGIFSNEGIDVAGVAHRDLEGAETYGRWVHYISVDDVADAEATVRRLGGRTLLHRTAAERGEFAIFSGSTEVLLGVIRSSSGDPADTRAWPGDWIWRQLFAHDVDAAAEAHRELVGYQIEDAEDTDSIVDRVLTSSGYARAGVTQLSDNSEEGPTWLGLVRVEDARATAKQAVELGGRILHEGPEGQMVVIAGPSGAIIGLLEFSYPDAPLEDS